MAGFTIHKVDYGNPASGAQTWTIKWKLSTNPGAYTTLSASALDDGSGNLITPLSVTGLTAGNLVYTQTTNNCESPAIIYQQSIPIQ